MININKNIQSEILMTTMEEIVPQDSLFRKIDKYIDLTFIYDKELDIYYEKETGEVLESKGLVDKNGYKAYINLDKTKLVRRYIHEEWNELFRDNRLSKEGEELYQKRKEHVERSKKINIIHGLFVLLKT